MKKVGKFFWDSATKASRFLWNGAKKIGRTLCVIKKVGSVLRKGGIKIVRLFSIGLWLGIATITIWLAVSGILERRITISTAVWIVLAIWAILSFKILKPEEMGVYVFLGIPLFFADSGPWFVPRLLTELRRYPKKMYNLDYLAREAITKAGVYPEKNGIFYGAQVVKVDATTYLNFPRERGIIDFPKKLSEKLRKELPEELLKEFPEELSREDLEKLLKKLPEELRKNVHKELEERTHPLIKILRAQVSIKDEELRDWTEEAVVGAIRAALGGVTWREAIENLKKVNEETEKIFLAEDGAIIKAGFRLPGIRLVITEIRLPKELEAVLPRPDQARLEEDAAKHVAKRQAIEWVKVILESMAISRGKEITDIEREIDDSLELRREFLDYAKDLNLRLEEAERGAFLDVRTQNPLLDLIALWQRMPLGVGRKPERGREIKEEREEEKEDKRDIREIIKEVG